MPCYHTDERHLHLILLPYHNMLQHSYTSLTLETVHFLQCMTLLYPPPPPLLLLPCPSLSFYHSTVLPPHTSPTLQAHLLCHCISWYCLHLSLSFYRSTLWDLHASPTLQAHLLCHCISQYHLHLSLSFYHSTVLPPHIALDVQAQLPFCCKNLPPLYLSLLLCHSTALPLHTVFVAHTNFLWYNTRPHYSSYPYPHYQHPFFCPLASHFSNLKTVYLWNIKTSSCTGSSSKG